MNTPEKNYAANNKTFTPVVPVLKQIKYVI